MRRKNEDSSAPEMKLNMNTMVNIKHELDKSVVIVGNDMIYSLF